MVKVVAGMKNVYPFTLYRFVSAFAFMWQHHASACEKT